MHGLMIALSNRLVDLGAWFEDRDHDAAARRVFAFRGAMDRWVCRAFLGHPRIVYGPMRDICLDCLAIIDEHPNGRGRTR